MKLGLIGKPGAGKTALFEALTNSKLDAAHRKEVRIGTVRVPDVRVERLSTMYQPRKTIYAQVEYLLPAPAESVKESTREQSIWTQVRDCDALLHVVRNFVGYDGEPPAPKADFLSFDQELILSDLMVVEKRLERLELDQKRGRKPDPEEMSLVRQCAEHLNKELPLRRFPQLAAAKLLRGYAFLSAKPCLLLFNNRDEDAALPEVQSWASDETCLAIRGKLEQELGQMPVDEAREFMAEFDIRDLAMDRVIHGSYALLGLISFFTVGEDEVRAWTIQKHTAAVDAAEVIHSDIKKGFIRAEVLAYNDLMAAGSYAEARKQGTVRLEGKTYEVQDGDIINFRFNV
ncbi:MAG: redox-regulated ATPase YchF [Desulfobacteraceae bacterium]|nr:MAG: redox-regulated ATPase YchF [Desulfobacteraceae bacterium]